MNSSDLERAGRRLWVGIRGPSLDPETRAHLLDLKPGGIVLFRRNVESKDQVCQLISDIRALLPSPVRLSVDHEGGLVTRFHRELTVFPGNMALGAAAFREPSMGVFLGEQQGEISARELADLGFDINLAPVLDLASTGDNPGITIRSFGGPTELVSELGAALARGTLRGGVLPSLKHFPGKGEATVDAHLDLPVIPEGDQEPHLAPFRRSLEEGASVVMTSHVIFRAMDADRPATLSSAVVTGLLRGRLGFRGVVVTDDMEMGAMQKHYGFDAMIRGASEAGHDVFCICHTYDLQRRARDLLAQGMSDRAPWIGDVDAVNARLMALAPPKREQRSSLPSGISLAEAIAGRAVTVHEDPRHLLPIRGRKTLLLLPTLTSLTGVENPLRGEEDGSELVAALGDDVTVRPLSMAPTDAEITEAIAQAKEFERVLVVTTNARFLRAQRDLLCSVAEQHPGAIHLAIRSPFDAEVLPMDTQATVVMTYGFRPVQLRALADVLHGRVQAYGRCPVVIRRT